MPKTKNQFITKLQQEAKLQARLNEERLLPRQLDPLTSVIGNYAWQVLMALSFISALALEIFKRTST